MAAVAAQFTEQASPMTRNTKATLVGGGIGNLAAAAFMIRDGDMEGSNITILDALPVMGGPPVPI
jgi:oleate hydratase